MIVSEDHIAILKALIYILPQDYYSASVEEALEIAVKLLENSNGLIVEELENIWEKIRALPDINPDYPMDRQIHISRHEVQNIIYERLSELKGENNG